MKIEIINIKNNKYPELLRCISNPPKQLYCLGNIDLLSTNCISIVGTRRASPYGRWASYEIAKRIALCDLTIVSGMAEGIDAQAHLGALDANGNTIAVLGNGVDVCFPKSNESLYEKIKNKGLIISEYPPGEKAQSWNFPQRNRIISALSKSVIVVEGALKSGSMITANLALNQGRDVYAVPGNINQPNSYGANTLIRDGAMPILSLDEICSTLGIESMLYKKTIAKLNSDEKRVVDCIRNAPGINADYLSLYTTLSSSSIAAMLVSLEMKGIIRSSGNSFYIDI